MVGNSVGMDSADIDSAGADSVWAANSAGGEN